jgi:hypothetical protein
MTRPTLQILDLSPLAVSKSIAAKLFMTGKDTISELQRLFLPDALLTIPPV